jgi:splicing factor 45
MPAWMTAKAGDDGAMAGRGGGAGGRGRGGGVDGQLQSGFGPPPTAEPEKTVAEKMMAKMGYQQGAGLGRDGQGIRSSLMVQKTDRNTGVITQAEPSASSPTAASASSQPTRVVLLLNMVGPGEVDGEL